MDKKEYKVSEPDTIQFILALLNQSIHPLSETTGSGLVIDWKQVDTIAKQNSLIPLLYDLTGSLPEQYAMPQTMKAEWKSITLSGMLLEFEKHKAMRHLITKAREQNITLVLFKGSVLANLYPKSVSRVSGDTDIFVYPHQKEKAMELLESLGYQKNLQHSKEQVPVYKHESMPHIIELHFSLWEDYQGPTLDLMEKLDLLNQSSLIHIQACGMDVTTLGYEQHLIYQIFHIVKHFILQGIGIRYLVDLTLYVERYSAQFDYDSFWSKMELLGYDVFCEMLFTVCVQHLGMPSDILAKRTIPHENETNKLLHDMMHVGQAFADKDASWQLLGIMTPYFSGDATIPNTKFKRWLYVLFPSSKSLTNEYDYARKYKLLLPVAWVHKWTYFLVKWFKHRRSWYNAQEKLVVSENRLALVRSLGLMDKHAKQD